MLKIEFWNFPERPLLNTSKKMRLIPIVPSGSRAALSRLIDLQCSLHTAYTAYCILHAHSAFGSPTMPQSSCVVPRRLASEFPASVVATNYRVPEPSTLTSLGTCFNVKWESCQWTEVSQRKQKATAVCSHFSFVPLVAIIVSRANALNGRWKKARIYASSAIVA